MTQKKSGLGRNLNVLLGPRVNPQSLLEEDSSGKIEQISIEGIEPGAYQPRRDMDPDALQELSDSIKQQGLIQPISVRRKSNKSVEIIAGERRYRAAKLAGLKKVPCIVHDVDDKTTLALALIENIQREDLNPLDEATALARLINEFDLTHQRAAEIIGKSRVSVSNLLRLLTLSSDVLPLLGEGRIEMGHARAILALDKDKQFEVAQIIVDRKMSVRETEALVRKMQQPVDEAPHNLNPVKEFYADQFRQVFSGFKVNLQSKTNGRHKVVIECRDDKELEKLLEMTSQENNKQ